MFRNYFVTALRHILKNKLYSFINVIGLAVGLAACLLIFLFVRYETSYDSWMPNGKNIYRTNFVQYFENGAHFTCGCAPGPTKAALDEWFPEIEQSVRLFDMFPVIAINDQSFKEEVWMAETNFFDLFELEFAEGSRETAFSDLANIVISERMAVKYFGVQSPLGETVTFNHMGADRSYKITGVFKNLPDNSEFKFNFLFPLDNTLYAEEVGVNKDWFLVWGWLYFSLADGTDPLTISEQLQAFTAANVPSPDHRTSNEVIEFSITNIRDIHLYSRSHPAGEFAGIKALGSITQIYTFTAIAALILLIACINFINLTTARSLQRTKEVAVRKVVGARRSQLVWQFLGESLLVALSSLVLALVFVELFLPVFAELMNVPLKANYLDDPLIMSMGFGLVGFVGLIGGLYPALFASSWRPAEVGRGDAPSHGMAGGQFRNYLTLFQFSVSVALIISTAIVYAQNLYSLNKDLGFAKENKLILAQLGSEFAKEHRAPIAAEVARLPEVDQVSLSLEIPSDYLGLHYPFQLLGASDAQGQEIFPMAIDADFFDVYEIPILAGRNFRADSPMDTIESPITIDGERRLSGAVILNETSMRQLGFMSPGDAIGKRLRSFDSSLEDYPIYAEIVGVVPDYHFNSLKEPMRSIIYWMRPDWFWRLSISYGEGVDAAALQTSVNDIWSKFVPYAPADSFFLKDRLAEQYGGEIRQGMLLLAFAILSVAIACLGLYGLAAFTAERRTKEIAIRKVHGAEVWDVVKMLLTQFSKPVLLSNLIAWPIAWFAMSDYLEGFVYRIELSPAYFIGTGLIALMIAWATTSFHAVKTARMRPAIVLRGE